MKEPSGSIWLCFLTALPAATMMQPTFASLIAIAMVLGFSFVLRYVAHREGRRNTMGGYT